jgi:hypothetical protein
VPLTVASQLLVRRQPLRDLWVRATPTFRLDRKGGVVALLLAALPMVMLVDSVIARQWVAAGWLTACVVGAAAAAFALRRFRRSDTRVTDGRRRGSSPHCGDCGTCRSTSAAPHSRVNTDQ